jgi:redox-sensing transcriptional repressor
LSLYRRLLLSLKAQGIDSVYSHQLASMGGSSAAQVRRDVMATGYSGSPAKGYDIDELVRCIGEVIDDPKGQRAALVGMGHLGRAVLNYFAGRRPKLQIRAAFDSDAHKTGRVLHGYHTYPVTKLARVVITEEITVGILCVPKEAAQTVADELVSAGCRGILNFAPVPLHVPPGVFVEDIDITMSLEKVAYYARQSAKDTAPKATKKTTLESHKEKALS